MISGRNILIIVIVLLILYKIKRDIENYKQMDYCIKKDYRELGREVLYQKCEAFGYVVPKSNIIGKPIRLYKCLIGLPHNSMKYKIIIDDFARYTQLQEYTDMGVVVGTYLKFDNGKEYQVINNNTNIII